MRTPCKSDIRESWRSKDVDEEAYTRVGAFFFFFFFFFFFDSIQKTKQNTAEAFFNCGSEMETAEMRRFNINTNV